MVKNLQRFKRKDPFYPIHPTGPLTTNFENVPVTHFITFKCYQPAAVNLKRRTLPLDECISTNYAILLLSRMDISLISPL